MIDARWIFPEISGIGLYTKELLNALVCLDTENEYTVLFNDTAVMQATSASLNASAAGNFTSKLLPYGVFSLKSQLQMPGVIRESRVDVYHSPNYMIPLAPFPYQRKGKTACVITIHDLIPLLFPDHAPKSKKTKMMPLYRFVMKQVASRADAILTVSLNSAGDIRRVLLPNPREHEKVHAVYNGVSAEYSRVQWKPSHSPQKLLYVGRLDPYKNVPALIRIFDGVRKQISSSVRLIIAGSPDPRYPEAMEECRRLRLEDHVEWTGYVPPEQLLKTYGDASVLVHPAKYEGFGLPVIEAMAAGVPVVCSSGGSLAEIVGDAACVHDFNDEPAFVNSVCAILNSASRAKELSLRGRKQAEKFTWTNTAKETLKVYRKAAGCQA